MKNLKAIVIGTSAGGLRALKFLLEKIPSDFTIPVLIVQHLKADTDTSWIRILSKSLKVNVKEGEDKEPIQEGYVYIAPPGYHMLVEFDETIALSKDEKVNFSRPSIDLLFESASDTYGACLAGIILTGSNKDGAKGLNSIQRKGGITIVQNPADAEYPEMPQAAIRTLKASHILTLQEIAGILLEYNKKR